MREKIHFYLNDKENKYARIIDVIIYIVIFITVIDHALQTMESMDKYHLILEEWEIVPIVLFSIEYLLRVYSAPNRIKFVFSFWGLIDSIALIPYYLGLPADLRELRVLRFISLLKYDPAIVNIGNVFNNIKKELMIFSILTIFLLYVAAVGIYHFENPAQPENFSDIFHSMWWAVATLTTVGYGDIYPITVGGKIFSSFIIFISLGVVAVPAGLIASAFSDIFKNKE
jgi:voltage-gated potassium channel|tara:strand:- start:1286 stop:1969 length:684 start_codon:yes stop_codon:yes gene_type:complete